MQANILLPGQVFGQDSIWVVLKISALKAFRQLLDGCFLKTKIQPCSSSQKK